MKLDRRAAILGALGAMAEASRAAAQANVVFFRIGTGGIVGTYFPLGGLVANALSNPPGSRPCDDGGSCGVPGLIVTAVATDGSVANIAGIVSGRMQSGFVQSDVAYWAYSGSGLYEGKPRVEGLRAIASLYPESIHLVTAKNSAIATVRDLRGKRVSLDEVGSGTLADARLILAAYGLSEADIRVEHLKPRAAGEKLKDGQLDALFSVSGWPEGSVAELAAATDIDLVPIDGPEAAKLINDHRFISRDDIPANTYRNVGAVRTVSVNAIWVTSASQPEDLIQAIVGALWSPNTRKLLDGGHAKGRAIRFEAAVQGLGIPLHPGAEKFYRDKGLIK